MMINVIDSGKFAGCLYLTLCFSNESDSGIAKALNVEKETYYALLKKFKAELMSSYNAIDDSDYAFKTKEDCLRCRDFISENAKTDDMKIAFDIPDHYMGITFNGTGSYADLFMYLKLNDDPKVRHMLLKKFKAQGMKARKSDKYILINYLKEIENNVDRKSKLDESLKTLDERLNKCIPYC